MAQLNITTLKGAVVTLSLSNTAINAAFTAGDKQHTFSMVKLARSAALGDYIDMGPVKAQISVETRAEIERTIISEQKANVALVAAEYKADKQAFLTSAAGKSWLLAKKMKCPGKPSI